MHCRAGYWPEAMPRLRRLLEGLRALGYEPSPPEELRPDGRPHSYLNFPDSANGINLETINSTSFTFTRGELKENSPKTRS